MPDQFPVLWLCGPSGVGKSTVAWGLFSDRPGAGHVDIDQLGMCFPEIPSDPGRTVLEARILGRVTENFRAAGASCLIVSGYIDSRRGIHTEYLPQAALTVLRLRCDQAELRRRLEARNGPGAHLDHALRDAQTLDQSALPYPYLDTTGRTATDVLADVRTRWPHHPPRPPGPWPDPPPTPGDILWLYGATAVGKSTVGFALAGHSRRTGHTTAFVDLQQIGFLHPAPAQDPGNHRLKAANLAAAWAEFHAHGATRLVVVGHVPHPTRMSLYADALPAATLTLGRLHAGPDSLRDRIRRRAQGDGPRIAGDTLRGQPAPVLAAAHQAAVAEAASLEHTGAGDLRIDTDGLPVDAITREIADRIGW